MYLWKVFTFFVFWFFFLAAVDHVIPDIFIRPAADYHLGSSISPENITLNINRTESGDYVIQTGQNFTIECHGAYPPALKVVRRNKIEVGCRLHVYDSCTELINFSNKR